MSGKQAPKQSETPPEDDSAEDSEFARSLRAGAEDEQPIVNERPLPPVKAKDPNEMPGARQNTNQVDWEPIRTDENGLVWYQEEVLKPATPRPRGRRVLTYEASETKTVQAKSGDYVETFEVSGEGPRHTEQAKITLPSYQVGMYRDPRYPFMIHVYNEKRGFDLFEVQAYYGGAEMVPPDVKRTYVENVLCYDMRTVIRAIQTEYRQLQLSGRVE